MVYVDSPEWQWKGRLWGHMTADDEDELHGMACALGLKFAWYQYPKSSRYPHYDLMETKFDRALKLGAVHVDKRVLVEKAKELRRRIAVLAALEYQRRCLRLELASVRQEILLRWTGGEGVVDIERLLRVIPR